MVTPDAKPILMALMMLFTLHWEAENGADEDNNITPADSHSIKIVLDMHLECFTALNQLLTLWEMPRNKHQSCHHLHVNVGGLNANWRPNSSDSGICLLCHCNNPTICGCGHGRNLTISWHARQQRGDPNPQSLSRVNDLLQRFCLIRQESSNALGIAIPFHVLGLWNSAISKGEWKQLIDTSC